METINVISNNNSLSLIAIGYNNGFIKLMGTYQNKYKIDTVFTKQNDGILCIKFDPLDEFFYASSIDGSYACYSIKTLTLNQMIHNCFKYKNENKHGNKNKHTSI